MSKLKNKTQSQFLSTKLNRFVYSVICAVLAAGFLLIFDDQAYAQQPEKITAAKKSVQSNSPETAELIIGTPLEGKMSDEDGGQTHSYLLRLKPGELIRANIEQNKAVSDATLDVIIFDPNNKELIRNEFDGTNIETVSAVAKSAGSYRVEVTKISFGNAQYKITLVERRSATAQDRTRFAAHQAKAAARAIGLKRTDSDSAKNAIAKYKEAANLLRAVGDRHEQAEVLTTIAGIYANQGDQSQALRLYQQALGLERTARDRRGEADTLFGLADFYLSLKNYQKAVEYYRQSAQASGAAGDQSFQAKTIYGIGYVYLESKLNNPQQALIFFNQALEMQRTLGDQREETKTLIKIGESQLKLNQPEQALENFEKALVLARQIQDANLKTDAQEAITQIKQAKTN